MTIRAQSADGVVHEFPDGTADAVIDNAMRGYAQQQAPKPKRSVYGEVAGAMANVNRGLGIGDEMAAGFKTAGNLFAGKIAPEGGGSGMDNRLGVARGVVSDFKRNMGSQRQLEDEFAQDRPKVAALSRGVGMAGAVAVPGGGNANLFAEGGRAVNMVRGATTAGLQAAGYAAVDRGSVKERALGAARAARDPVTLGLGAAAGALATPARARPQKQAAPDLKQLQAQRTAAYGAVDESGVRYTPEATAELIGSMKADLAKSRFDPDFHPKAGAMVKKLDERVAQGYSPTISELDDLRKFIGENVSGTMDRTERRLGRQMTGQIDQFIETAGPEAVSAGSADDAAGLIRNARQLHGKVRKVETVTDAMARAERQAGKTGSGGNIDNAIRQQMDRVLQKTPNLSAEEKAALESIVMGDRVQNTLRQVGKFSPSGNGLSQWFNLGAVAAAGPAGAAVPVAGFAAKQAADAMTRQKVKDLIRLVAEGNPQQLQQAQQELAQASGPAAEALRRAVAAKLTRAVGVSGGARAAQPANIFAQP